MPYACVDDKDYGIEGGFKSLSDDGDIEGEANILLPNLGRASSNAYWIDLTVRVILSHYNFVDNKDL